MLDCMFWLKEPFPFELITPLHHTHPFPNMKTDELVSTKISVYSFPHNFVC